MRINDIAAMLQAAIDPIGVAWRAASWSALLAVGPACVPASVDIYSSMTQQVSVTPVGASSGRAGRNCAVGAPQPKQVRNGSIDPPGSNLVRTRSASSREMRM
ncbi:MULTISPECIES: hypothetical protein [Ramlibacter]|uniref:Uncharacterized protein n=1 Tax=Ramlibacter pinisoli TaxID=2682844 RepID=A0A6N8IYL3_9BURK|nr:MULTISPECIES: hypothetical protein [Ramlibacter]MBA2962131.1 hypothetical protein [Ramlibacter sp. CGMCC 1.13660]MVQ32074.1 hypothetical protein [Ramlibacter pinisoli]